MTGRFPGAWAAQCWDQDVLGGRSGSRAAGGVDGHHGDVLGLSVLPIVSRQKGAPTVEVWIRSKRFAKQWGICSGAWNATRHWLDRGGSQPVPTFGPEHEY